MNATQLETTNSIRENCRGRFPLDAIIEPWMLQTFENNLIHGWLGSYGSPLNILSTQPFQRNADTYNQIAHRHLLDFQVFFARKANKCLSFVRSTKKAGCGVDVASLPELEQTIHEGVEPRNIFCTAAIKSEELIRCCVVNDIVLAVDNLDELELVCSAAIANGKQAEIALRVGGFEHEGKKLFSRFGFDVDEVVSMVRQHFNDAGSRQPLPKLVGIHFHLDGYCYRQRASAIEQSLKIIDTLRSKGHELRFLDIGGGIPVTYLESKEQWDGFWKQLRLAISGAKPPITYGNDGLGLICTESGVEGKRQSYPYYREPFAADDEIEQMGESKLSVQNSWLHALFSSRLQNTTVVDAIRSRDLQLRIEPGRSLLDGCGMTIAKVEFCKQHPSGHTLIGLAMNHTQCRTSSADFLVDPILIPANDRKELPAIESGFLVGAYCTESELLCKRSLRFPRGIARGDLIVFPNTAGYFMHFLESRSHQFPLARNIFVDRSGDCAVDPIDY